MKIFFFLLGLVGLSGITFGQNTIGLPFVRNFSKSEFHGGAQTWDIKQDKNGILYFANNEGLLSYDGTIWKLNTLPNKTILRSLGIDDIQARIYVGGQGEIGYFEADYRGQLKFHSLINLLPESEKDFADIWDISNIHGSIFFRATDRIFEYKNQSIQVFKPKTAWQFMGVAGGELWAQDRLNGIFHYQNHTWHPVKNNSILKNDFVSGIVPMQVGRLLVTTINRKEYILNQDSLQFLSGTSGLEKFKTEIYKITALARDEFVAGTTSEGCLFMNYKGDLIQKISQPEGLQNSHVLCVFLDKDQNLWSGLNNGISFISYNSSIRFIRPDKTNDLAGFSTQIIDHQLYVGTSDGAFVANLPKNFKDISFLKGDFQPVGNSKGQVWRIEEINQDLLMGHNRGTFEIKNQVAKEISRDESWIFLPESPVLPSKYILAGTYTGLKLIESDNKGFRDLGNLNGTYESFRFLEQDNNGGIWASHPYRGIYKLKVLKDKTHYVSKLFTQKDGLPSSINNYVFKIKNKIIFATTKGAYEFDSIKNKFIPSTNLTPIFGQMELRYLNEDEKGNIWFCNGKTIGIVLFENQFNNQNFKKVNISELNGEILSGFENIYPFNQNNIFIASEKGIIHLDLEKYLQTRRKLSMVISGVKFLGNSDKTIFGGNFPMNKDSLLKLENEAQFPYRTNSFHFAFSSPSFTLSNNIVYSTFLEGYDKKWSSASANTFKEYINLPEGKYIFHARASDNLGFISEIKSYSFTINPPFYRSPPAYGIYAVLLFISFIIINRWQEIKLSKQKIKYEEKQNQIIALHNLEIEKNEKEIIKLQNEALLQEVLLKKIELANASLHLVEREDSMSRVKEELQKLSKTSGELSQINSALVLLSDIEKNKTNWDQFALHFNEINNDFLKKIKTSFPKLTISDLKLCAYLQLNLSSKEISKLMIISVRGVEINRYRLRKKLNLGKDQSLHNFLNSIT